MESLHKLSLLLAAIVVPAMLAIIAAGTSRVYTETSPLNMAYWLVHLFLVTIVFFRIFKPVVFVYIRMTIMRNKCNRIIKKAKKYI